jgi:hypothetical protein
LGHCCHCCDCGADTVKLCRQPIGSHPPMLLFRAVCLTWKN